MSAPKTIIDWAKTQRAIWQWAVDQLCLAPEQVIWGRQNVAQAKRPYCSLDMVSGPGMYGQDGVKYLYESDAPAGEELQVLHYGARRFVVSANIFANVRSDDNTESLGFEDLAIAYASKLQESLDQRSIREALGAANITVSDVKPVVQFLQSDGDEIVSRASVDVEFFVAGARETARTTYIETLIGDATLVAPVAPNTTVPFTIDLET